MAMKITPGRLGILIGPRPPVLYSVEHNPPKLVHPNLTQCSLRIREESVSIEPKKGVEVGITGGHGSTYHLTIIKLSRGRSSFPALYWRPRRILEDGAIQRNHRFTLTGNPRSHA